MSLFYKIAYAIGFAPWEKAASHPPAAEHVAAIFDRATRNFPCGPGKALDIGCGTGHWAIELARRGWTVTGVDIVARAVRQAEGAARMMGLDIDFILDDLTRPGPLLEAGPFDFLWDFGAIHGLDRQGRKNAGLTITKIAAPGAVLEILVWSPGRRGPLPRGASEVDIREAFEGWELVARDPFDATGLPPMLQDTDPHCYRLRRP
ncbi:MAG: class I SAM-dependent methyltransferase [Alphaproteobacteria bacterium]|nr:MAG: class I SAM-dependent methyltransferase [Alphaproteobacteria bacterium]